MGIPILVRRCLYSEYTPRCYRQTQNISDVGHEGLITDELMTYTIVNQEENKLRKSWFYNDTKSSNETICWYHFDSRPAYQYTQVYLYWFLLQSIPMTQTSTSASVTPRTPAWMPQSPHSCPPVLPCWELWLRLQTTCVSASLEHPAAMATCTHRGYRGTITCTLGSSRYMETQL